MNRIPIQKMSDSRQNQLVSNLKTHFEKTKGRGIKRKSGTPRNVPPLMETIKLTGSTDNYHLARSIILPQ
jgi:hypothetical protein